MVKYKAYPVYQSANSQWIDIIPLEWARASLKFLVSDRITDGPHETPNFIDEGIPFLSAEAIKFSKLDFSRKRSYISLKLHEKYSLKCLPQRDDIFMVKSGNTTGAVAIVETDEVFNIWSPLALIRCNKKIVIPRYVYYSMLADYFQTSVQLSWSQGTQPNIGMGVIENLHLTYPELTVQHKVVSFLDHETAKIDNLIEKQQQLIELLKEKRQAVISHAVTKGLNPDVPMKDSGVEWLGEVPAHWSTKPLRYLGDCQNGINIGAEAFGSGYPFVSYGDVYNNRVLPENGSGLVQSTVDDRRKYSLLRGDVLFTRTSETIEEIGFASACIKSIENACFAGFLIRFRPKPSDLYVEFSKYYFSNQLLRIFFTKEMNLITRASLSQDLLKTMPVVIPPVDEQIKIAELLDNISEKFDQLQLLGEEQIKYLQERRTVLISAAVTGKIDVRDWVAPDTQDAEEPQEATA